MIGAWNIFILIVLVLLALLNPLLLALWLFCLIPLFFTGYWLWIAQHILIIYHRLPSWTIVRIALTATLPFAYVTVIAAMILYVPAIDGALSGAAIRLASFSLFTSLGLTVLCPSVLVYGLQHRIHVHPLTMTRSRRASSKV